MQDKAVLHRIEQRNSVIANGSLIMRKEKSELNRLVYLRNSGLYIVRSQAEILPVADLEGTK